MRDKPGLDSWPKREVVRDVGKLIQAIYDAMIEANIPAETALDIIDSAFAAVIAGDKP